jgi:hypothetical protein
VGAAQHWSAAQRYTRRPTEPKSEGRRIPTNSLILRIFLHRCATKVDSEVETPNSRPERVAARVSQGGHDVPAEVIRRRFASGMRNFLDDVYRPRVDFWQWFDNSGRQPRLLEEGTNR